MKNHLFLNTKSSSVKGKPLEELYFQADPDIAYAFYEKYPSPAKLKGVTVEELGTLEGTLFLMKAMVPFTDEREILEDMIYEACLAYVDKWKNAKDSYEVGKLIGEALGFLISIFVVEVKAVQVLGKTITALKGTKAIGKFDRMLANYTGSDRAGYARKIVKMMMATAEVMPVLINNLKKVPGNIVKVADEISDEGSKIIVKIKQNVLSIDKTDLKAALKAEGFTDNAADTAIECIGDTGCFTGDTLVMTKDGYKQIDEVQQGEFVFSRNVETGDTEFKKVAHIYIKDAYTFVNLTIGNEIIRTTPVHLFYTVDGEWKEAVNLKVGDKIVDSDGSCKEISARKIQYLDQPERIFNLNVEDYHTYFVGSNGLLVHNTRKCTPEMIKAINASRESIANVMVNNISQLKNYVRRMVDCGGYIEVQDLDGNLMHIDRTDILDADSKVLRNTEIEIRQNMRKQLGRKDLAGKNHPDSGVLFDSEGYPVFDTEFEMDLDPKDYLRSRGTHFNRSSKSFYNEIQRNPKLIQKLKLTPDEIEDFRLGDVPERFTWHHHQDTGKMQLVDYNTHRLTGHDGGYSVWGPGN